MPQYGVQDIIKFAGAGKPAKFGDAFGQMMQGKVNAGVEAIRQKVAAKLAGLDPTGERGDGPEEVVDDPVDDVEMELTDDEVEELEAEEPDEGSGEETDEDSETNT